MLKTLKKRLKDQRGLTLVELLAVIVILGIIAAIAVPSIGNIIAKSKFDAAKADALQIIAAATMADAAGVDLSKDGNATGLIDYLDITDDNIDTGWSVTKTAGEIELSGATSKHPAKDDTKHNFDGTRADINKMTYEEPTSTP